ncbi:MAG: thiamine pyrophosphate-dependent enzyme [Patescibacteria group bacterium]
MTWQDYLTPNKCTWCPGCGNFGIWSAFERAALAAGWDNSNTALVAGIGCHGHIVNFIGLTTFEGLHGRPIPVAAGLKLANSQLNVFVFTGDGDCLAEGGNHLIHAARRNQNITVIIHDNAIYGLTAGQTSPRSPQGLASKSTPDGNLEEPIHPLRLALAAGATFLARTYSGDIDQCSDILIKANQHDGLAVVQILQPCVTFNQVYSHIFYQENTYQLPADYDPTDRAAAFAKTMEWGEKQIPVGILYQANEPSYESRIPQISRQPLVKAAVRKRNIGKILKQYL